MRAGISISVTATDQARLEAIIAARSSPQKHVWRARIILLSDQGLGTGAIMVEGVEGYRLLKAHDLITSPAYVVIKASDQFHTKATRSNEMW